MLFEKERTYHINKQWNKGCGIFFCKENYLFFFKKVIIFFLPYSNILVWCLMPNHFHFLVLVKQEELVSDIARGVNFCHPSSRPASILRSLNQLIAIMLHSYTRAINKTDMFHRKEIMLT